MSKGLEKFTYADVVRMTRPEPAAGLGTPAPVLGTGNRVPAAPILPTVPRESRSERSRQRLNKRQFNISIDADLLDKVATLSMYQRRSLADIGQRALWAYVQENWTDPSVPSVPSVPAAPNVREDLNQNQMMKMDDDDWAAAVEIYQRVTGNDYTERDRDFLELIRQYGARCLACAVFIGRERKHGQRIGKMAYFANIVSEVAAWQPDKIQRELEYHLRLLLQRQPALQP